MGQGLKGHGLAAWARKTQLPFPFLLSFPLDSPLWGQHAVSYPYIRRLVNYLLRIISSVEGVLGSRVLGFVLQKESRTSTKSQRKNKF